MQKIISKQNKGLATIELLIAFAILLMNVTGIMLLVNSGQSVSVDSETNTEALSLAGRNIEIKKAEAVSDFNSIVSDDDLQPAYDSFYQDEINVRDISPCVKDLISSVFWKSEQRDQHVDLTTRITSIEELIKLGGFCDPTPPESNWDTPTSYGSLTAGEVNGEATGIDMAFIDGERYAFLSVFHSDPSKPDFIVIDTTNPESPLLISGSSLDVGKGLNGIVVSGNFAYVISNDVVDHLKVINISNPNSPVYLPDSSKTLPNLTNGIPRSIYYYDEKIYIGTQFVPCIGCPEEINNELHIYDVSTDPSNPEWEGSIDVDRNVNSIIVRNNILYTAIGPGSTSPYTPLRIYNSNTSSGDFGELIGTFGILGNQAGTSLFTLGEKLYLGLQRATGSNKDFYILDISDLSEPKEFNPNSSYKLGLQGSNSSVSTILVQGDYAFLGIRNSNPQESSLQIWNILNPTGAQRSNTCTIGDPIPKDPSGMIYSNNFIFSSFRSNSAFQVIYDDPNLSCT